MDVPDAADHKDETLDDYLGTSGKTSKETSNATSR